MQTNQQEPKKSVNAKEYIERHNLEPVLAEMLNTLVYEKTRTPEIFMIKYLSSLLSKEDRIKHGIHVPESSLPTPQKIVKYPAPLKNELVKRHLTKKLWDEIKFKSTKFGGTVSDLLVEGEGGLTLTDSDCLNVFSELVTGVINNLHDLSLPLRKIERHNENPNKCIEYSWNNLQFYKFEYSRNLSNYPFPIKCKPSLLSEINEKIDAAVKSLNKTDPVYDFKSVKFSEKPFEFSDLQSNHRIFLWNLPSNYSTIYHNLNQDNSDDIKIFFVVNDDSHLRIVVNASKSKMYDSYEKLLEIYKILDKKLNFEFDASYGFLNSNIRNLGNAISFYGEFVMDKLIENKPELFEEIRKTFDISILEINQSTLSSEKQKMIIIRMTQNLKETENEFLENVFQRIYNLDYLNTNYNKDVRVENISSRIKEEEQKAQSSQEKEFFSVVGKSYIDSYALHQFSHLHPNNITLNSIIEDIFLNVNNSEYFNLFPQFYTTYMSSNKSLYKDILNKEVYDKVCRNLKDFRDSLINFDIFSFTVLRSFNIKIRRNIQGFNFIHYLSDAEKENLLKILNNIIVETFAKENFEVENSTNSYHFKEKQITIQLGKGDHLCLELNFKQRNSYLGKLIEKFFDIYQKLTENLEKNNLKYLSSANLGFFTNDLRYLGTGLSLLSEIEVSEQTNYELPSHCFTEGFYLEQGTLEENGLISLKLGCNLKAHTGVYRIFNVLIDIFKRLKVPNYSSDAKKMIQEKNEEVI